MRGLQHRDLRRIPTIEHVPVRCSYINIFNSLIYIFVKQYWCYVNLIQRTNNVNKLEFDC